MSKLVTIENCAECPCCTGLLSDFCAYSRREIASVELLTPDWCELPDAKDLKRMERVREVMEALKTERFNCDFRLTQFNLSDIHTPTPDTVEHEKEASVYEDIITRLEEALK